MKLSEDMTKTMNLKESVYQRIVDEFGVDIPLMANLPKDEMVEDVHFKCMARIKAIADTLVKRSNRFRTVSHAFRAFCYLGAHICYHLIPDGEIDRAKYAEFYKTIKENTEDFLIYMDQFTEALSQVERLMDAERLSFGKEEEITKRIEAIVEALPPPTHYSARVIIKKMRSEAQTPRFDRKDKPRDSMGRFRS